MTWPDSGNVENGARIPGTGSRSVENDELWLTGVDESTTMNPAECEEEQMAARESTQIIGIRLPKQTVVAFRKEAAGRNVRLNELFQEMWELYRQGRRDEQAKKKNT